MKYIKVTNNRKYIEVPFEDGETVAQSLNKVMDFKTPCHGKGACGRCAIDIVREDGTINKQIGCLYKSKEMTIYMPVIKIREGIEVELKDVN